MSLSVRARIIAGFGLLVLLLIAVTAGAAIQQRKHQSQLAELDHHSRVATLLQTDEAQASMAGDELQRYIDAGDTTYVSEIDTHVKAAQQSLLAALALDAPAGTDQMTAVAAQLVQDAARVVALQEAGDHTDAAALMETMVPIFRDHALKLESMTADELAQVTELRASADRTGNLAFWLLVVSGSIGAVIGLAVSFWVARSIVRPLAQLEVTARQASEGDLSARAPDRGPRELSHLGSVLNEMMSAIEKRTEDLSLANRYLTDARTQAATDLLTSLGNHRSFHKRLQDEAAEAAASSGRLGLVMMDLDGFKEVNDSLGHLAGDQLLREVASAIIGVVGDENAYRYGGDEFAVLVPDGDQLTTMTTAESLRHAFLAIDHPTAGRVAASFGVASMPESASTPEELVYRADMAMYLAKSSGKDRVAGWGSDRAMIEPSLELASNELLERNALIKLDVETRGRTEQQLTETLSVLASTLESTADGILVLSMRPERKISSFNQRFLDMWKIPREVAETHNPQLLIDFVLDQLADPDAFLATMAGVYRDPETPSFDTLKFKDGRVFERASFPQRIDGKPVGRVWSFSDVSERAHAELALQRSEEKFSKAFYRSPLAITITSVEDDRFVELNDAFARFSGHERTLALGRTSAELDLWVSQDECKNVRQMILEHGHARELPTQFRTKSGQIRDCLLTAELIELDGRDCVLSLVMDVTDRVRAEEAIRTSEEYFRSLIERSSDVILVMDTEARVTYASPSLTQVLGYSPEDVYGLNGLTFVHPDDIAETTKSFGRAVLGTNEDGAIEIRGRHSDGSWRVLEAMSRQIVGTDGQTAIVVNFRDVTERTRAEEMIRFMAYHDALTGLPNHDLLRDRMDQAIGQARRNEEHLAVIYLDLDRLKDVNDSVGHPGGDDVLREVSKRLSGISRDGDTVARLGGDEFVLLMPNVTDVEEAVKFANRILESLRRPVAVSGQEFRVTASIGIAIFPDDGRDSDTLVRNSDVAMHRAKEQDGDNLQLFAASMNASIVARLSVERELMQAQERGEFVLYYQPIATVAAQQIVSAEALIRWQHPERGLVMPDEFIPIAEETGLILQIGAWVLETACRQGVEWERICPGFRVAVNVSAKQVREPNFVAIVRDALWKSGLSPDALELEVTETAAMTSPERIAQALGALRSMGVRPVIDDFGTGYSSLSHLKQLPVVKLKIDKSFTHHVTSGENDTAIASATIAMAHSLDLSVTAEGVEEQEQLDFYRAHGCDEFQGYLLAKPGSPDEITRMIKESARPSAGHVKSGAPTM